MRVKGQNFATELGQKERESMCSYPKLLSWLNWEMVIPLAERGKTGVTTIYGRDNQFGFGNFDL